YAVGVAGRGRLPREITSLPQGAAAPGRGRPFEAVLELQFLEGDATAGLVTSSPPSTATRSAWTRASGTRRRIAIATARSTSGWPRSKRSARSSRPTRAHADRRPRRHSTTGSPLRAFRPRATDAAGAAESSPPLLT